jgi:hypothetical protein
VTWPVPDLTVNLVLWGVIWGALWAWQFVTMARRPDLPSFGDLVLAVQRWRLGRLLLFAGWVWLGWHVFVRGDWGLGSGTPWDS